MYQGGIDYDDDGGDEAAAIPSSLWHMVSCKASERRKRLLKRAKKDDGSTTTSSSSSSSPCIVRRFQYDSTRQSWCGECGCGEEQNLFFEYFSSVRRESSRKRGGGGGGRNGNGNGKGENEDGEAWVSDDYIVLQFVDGAGQKGKEKEYSYQYQCDSIRERILRCGLTSPGDGSRDTRRFHVLGCSNSQVRKGAFLFRRTSGGTKENGRFLREILPTLDRLESSKGVSKRVKYSGLLFSGVRAFVRLPDDAEVRELPSVRCDKYDFTDGVGLISLPLARLVRRTMNLPEVPSVIQIRYGGNVSTLSEGVVPFVCKGVLLLDPTETERRVISFRKSMLKVELSRKGKWCAHMDFKLGIVDYSRRKVGKLNQQLTCLLSATIPSDDLLSIQETHLDKMRNCRTDPFALGWLVALEENPKSWDSYEKLVLKDFNRQRVESSFVALSQRRTRYCNELGTLQIHLGCSRTLFGTAFPEQLHDFLAEGQCLVFTERGLLVSTVLASRSPSYSTGDVRILEAVDLPPSLSPLRALRNCVIFATAGSRPEPDKMSGGDLDGDMYLIIWDHRLLKYAPQLRAERPADYDTPPPTTTSSTAADASAKEDWIAYAARWDDSILGIIDGAFLATAREKGVRSEEAKRLNEIFSSLVDKNPESLRELDRIVGSSYLPGRRSDGGESCVWDVMLRRQLSCGAQMRSERHVPGEEEYRLFNRGLDRAGRMRLVESVKIWSGHFVSCVGRTKVDSLIDKLIAQIEADDRDLDCGEELPDSLDEGLEQTIDPHEIRALERAFDERCAAWERRAKDIFEGPLTEWDTGRRELLSRIEEEREKKRQRLDEFEAEREETRQNKIDCEERMMETRARTRKHLLAADAEKRIQLERFDRMLLHRRNERAVVEKKKSEIAEEKKRLPFSFFYLFVQNPRRVELEEEERLLEVTIARMLKDEEVVEQEKTDYLSIRDIEWERLAAKESAISEELRTYKNSLAEVDESERQFLNGQLRSELEFKADMVEAELEQTRSALDEQEREYSRVRESLERKKNEKTECQRSLEKLSAKVKQAQLIHNEFESYFAKNRLTISEYFTSSMLSESSYLVLAGKARKFSRFNSFWESNLRTCFQMNISKKRRSASPRLEDRKTLCLLYTNVLNALAKIIDGERKSQSKMEEFARIAEEVSSSLEHLKKVKSDYNVTAVRRKINRTKKNIRTKKTEGTVTTGKEDAMSRQLEELCEKLRSMEVDLVEIESEIDRLQRQEYEAIQGKRDEAAFLGLCDEFKKELDKCRGELVGGLPRFLFLGFKCIFDRTPGLDDVKEKFMSLDALEKQSKRKDGGCTDPHFFRECMKIVEESAIEVVETKNSTAEALREGLEKLASLRNEIYILEDQEKNISVLCCEYKNMISSLEADFSSQKETLRGMFCAEDLQQFEDEWQDTAFEDSVNVGIGHVAHCRRTAIREWKSSRSSAKSLSDGYELLETLDREFLRVCSIEENRLLGIPHKGDRRGPMPVYDKRAELLRALSDSNVVIITAGTGCGKSTQLPAYILDDFHAHTSRPVGSKRKFVRICCTQPRRLAAQSVACRVAKEYLTALGNRVGYRVGIRGSNAADARKVSADTQIEFVTEGWLLHRLVTSPDSLCNYDCIILDEAHERNRETDLLLALLKRSLEEEIAPVLKVVVMSATIDPATFCEYFNDCPALDCPGRIYPVAEFFCPSETVEEEDELSIHAERVLFHSILGNFGKAHNYEEGDVLIFLAGSAQITSCVERINKRAHKEKMPFVVAYPLFAQMDEKDKDASTDPSHRTGLDSNTDGRHQMSRKVICCTNIAETSLTIDGIRL